MKTIFKIFPILTIVCYLLLGFTPFTETTEVKCMIQMSNYVGEGAYVVVSLLNAEDEYEETLYVQGKDAEWYSDITEWWKFYGKRRPAIDAISGETISGGERSISILKIPKDKINTGYSIRFETAVEDQEYYVDDVQFKLTSDNITTKVEGKGFIRYIRMMSQ